MTSCEQHLRAAEGFLELGLPKEANAKLDLLPPDVRTLPSVLAMRIVIYQALRRWKLMQAMAEVLGVLCPDEPECPVAVAYAVRQRYSAGRARRVLRLTLIRFPEAAVVRFNLARYEAECGDLSAARMHLGAAVRLQPACFRLALESPELAPFHAQLLGKTVDAPVLVGQRSHREDDLTAVPDLGGRQAG